MKINSKTYLAPDVLDVARVPANIVCGSVKGTQIEEYEEEEQYYLF